LHFLPDGFQVPDCNIARRVNRLQIELDEPFGKSNDPISISVGSLGVKVCNSGD